jgi:hypothetical protein
MIYTSCFKEEYQAAKTELSVTINDESCILGDLDCKNVRIAATSSLPMPRAWKLTRNVVSSCPKGATEISRGWPQRGNPRK